MSTKLKLGFYGHSNCAYRSPTSFIDIVAEQLNAVIVNVGVRMGSEERALLALKQTRPDIAVVFHSQSKLIPTLNRNYDCDASSNWGLKDDEIPIIDNYRIHIRNIELERARLYGAAIQIEQYCVDNNIILINCIDPSHPFPSWIKMSYPDPIPMTLAKQYQCEFHNHANGITLDGNKLISTHLINIIAARGREVKCI